MKKKRAKTEAKSNQNRHPPQILGSLAGPNPFPKALVPSQPAMKELSGWRLVLAKTVSEQRTNACVVPESYDRLQRLCVGHAHSNTNSSQTGKKGMGRD